MALRYSVPAFFLVLKLAAGLVMLVLTGMMMLGRIGVGIGGIGLAAVLVAAIVSGAAKKRKLRAALAEVDAEYPSQRGE